MHPEALARWAALLRSSGGACVRRHIAHDTLYDDHLTTPAPASAFGPGVIPTSFLVNWPNWAASSVLFAVAPVDLDALGFPFLQFERLQRIHQNVIPGIFEDS